MLRSNSSPFPDLQMGLLCLYLFILLLGSFPTPQSFRLTPKLSGEYRVPICLLVHHKGARACLFQLMTSQWRHRWSPQLVWESSLLVLVFYGSHRRVTGCWPVSIRVTSWAVKCSATLSFPPYYCLLRFPLSECHMMAVIQHVAVPRWPFPLSSNFHFPFTCRTCFSCQ